MTEVARLLLDGIDEDAVDFRPTYDGSESEPIVLPGAFPNLLANGSQGIAVGMATAIPPHNAAELCDAALFLIDNPNARAKTLLKYVQGPDFPTGGIIVDHAGDDRRSLRHRPRLVPRARKWTQGRDRPRHLSDRRHGNSVAGAARPRLIERMAELFNEKKLPLVDDFRDESTEDVRIVIEPKSRTVDPELLMESLFKLTELESRISLNMNVLLQGQGAQGDGPGRGAAASGSITAARC